METNSPCADFSVIASTLLCGNDIAKICAMVDIMVHLARGETLPGDIQLHHLISSLSSILIQAHSHITMNHAARYALKAIRASVTTNMTMDLSARNNALYAINCCWEDEAFGYILRDPIDLRLLTLPAQRGALRIMQTCLSRFPGHANDVRCIVGFVSLLSSPHTEVVCGCADALLPLCSIVPGFAYAVAKAYCNLITHTPSLRTENMLIVLDRLQQLRSAIMEGSGMDDMATYVLRALAVGDLAVQQKVLNLAMGLLTPWNIKSMVHFLHNEKNAATATTEYCVMLERAIQACSKKMILEGDMH